jgi:hypothetical protein
VGELLIAIQIYIDAHNADPKPFVWTASAETMLGDPEPSPDRCRRARFRTYRAALRSLALGHAARRYCDN